VFDSGLKTSPAISSSHFFSESSRSHNPDHTEQCFLTPQTLALNWIVQRRKPTILSHLACRSAHGHRITAWHRT
jgi:hypothetical protein